jgi:dGTPase
VKGRPVTYSPYAADEERSIGRRYPEKPHGYRDEFQRDRDRIIHSTAFRRLVYKTQVFVNHEGDMFRTRLTHSLEVAQIARTAATILGLNEPLVEAICLAHDLGHTPFGHAGQDALNACMRDFGGFEHNLQSLRVVDLLEERYAEFPGLNLMFETREGILKHCGVRNARSLGDVGMRFLQRTQPGLEAQLSNLADEIAYNNHDIDDGVRAGLLDEKELCELDLFGRQYREVKKRYPEIAGRRLMHEVIRRMINYVVTDLVGNSSALIAEAAPGSVDDVRSQTGPLIAFGDQVKTENRVLKQYLHKNLYQHYRVLRMTNKAARVIRELFDAFMEDGRLMPREHAGKAEKALAEDGDAGKARIVADYVAGMTDRYAILEHRRLFDPSERT